MQISYNGWIIMENEYAIKVNHVTKRYRLYEKNGDRVKDALGLSKNKQLYKDLYALKDLSFDVKKGEAVGIIGVNGAGKSTILKIVTGVLHPTEGNVEINGRISALLELGAGFNSDYTGLQNVYLNGTMMGFSKEEIDAKLDTILEFADIGDFINQPVKTYSSGMFVRLAFAVAINIDPEILIVDEALSVGDTFFQTKCFRKFEEFINAGKTILFVSHDLSSIRRYCNKAILLNHGEKIAEGEPAEVIDIYKRVLVGQYDESEIKEEKDHGVKKVIVPNATVNVGEWNKNYVRNPKCDEYGDRDVEIIDYAIIDNRGKYTNILTKGEPFQIKIRIRANKHAHEPIVAYTFKTVMGTDVTGTNTLFEHNDIGSLEAGEERTITFTQTLNLQGSQYLMSFGCTRYESTEFKVFHRLYDVIYITVVSEKNTVGFYDMFSKVEIEK